MAFFFFFAVLLHDFFMNVIINTTCVHTTLNHFSRILFDGQELVETETLREELGIHVKKDWLYKPGFPLT